MESKTKADEPNAKDMKDMKDVKEERSLQDCKTYMEVIDYANSLFPGWIQMTIDDYSDDYRSLRYSWHAFCKKLNTTPKFIMLVTHINHKNKIVSDICDALTKFGICVRRESEFTRCGICHKAILSEGMYKYLQEKNSFTIPVEWSQNCITCKSLGN